MTPTPRISLLATAVLVLVSPAFAAKQGAPGMTISGRNAPAIVISASVGVAAPAPAGFGAALLTTLPLKAAEVNVGLPQAVALPAALIPAAALPAAHPLSERALPVREALAGASFDVVEAIAADQSGLQGRDRLEAMFAGRKQGRGGVSASQNAFRRPPDASRDNVFVVNDEGIEINARAATYYKEVRRLVEKYRGRLDLGESLDVMDDTYADVWAKLAAIESIAKARGIQKQNTHLEETLLWVDGTIDDHGRNVAIHTHRVFFHSSSNPDKAKKAHSEISEGIRRVDRYIEESLRNFAPEGKAEQVLKKLDEVVLVFDTRGYDQIKDHLKAREREINAAHGARYRFVYVDELAKIPPTTEAMRSALNALVKKYKGKGLQKIIEGVIYSRYVGVLLELKTIEHFVEQNYAVEQSGRDLFDPATGDYITELDTVVRSPKGRLVVVEAKSARVKLPHEEALRDKILYKLETYKKNRALMERSLGGPFDIVFSLDVGKNLELADFLHRKEAELSKTYGFNVSFIFLQSGPEEDAAPQDGGRPSKRRRR